MKRHLEEAEKLVEKINKPRTKWMTIKRVFKASKLDAKLRDINVKINHGLTSFNVGQTLSGNKSTEKGFEDLKKDNEDLKKSTEDVLKEVRVSEMYACMEVMTGFNVSQTLSGYKSTEKGFEDLKKDNEDLKKSTEDILKGVRVSEMYACMEVVPLSISLWCLSF